MNGENKDDHIGTRIRAARIAAEWTQGYLAWVTGVPVFQISHIENGRIRGREHLVKRLCNELMVDMETE